MNVAVALEQRFDRTPDGRIWTTGAFSEAFWRRYLAVFDSVSVIARALDVASAEAGAKIVTGDGIQFFGVPYFHGPLQYALKSHAVHQYVKSKVGTSDAVILRAPGTIATDLLAVLRPSDRPFGMEIIGDPYDVFAPGAVTHPLRPFFRWWFTRQLRRQVSSASSLAYATQGVLQTRYPGADDAFSTSFSDVDLSGDVFSPRPRAELARKSSLYIVMVGSLEQLYKAPDVLIDAVGRCVESGLDLHLTILGDGRHRTELEARRDARGLRDRVVFAGHLPAGAAVREQLDRADLFVLPSRTEGLPRAIIEAMARGLPCIGSTVGGIPELLPADDLVPPGDAAALATKIGEIARDPDRMARMSARNLERARDYRDDLMQERRVNFYRSLRQDTEKWIERQRSS